MIYLFPVTTQHLQGSRLLNYVPSQKGGAPLHVPLSWQTLVANPCREKPASQVYVAFEPSVVAVKVTEPLGGLVSSSQSAGGGGRHVRYSTSNGLWDTAKETL